MELTTTGNKVELQKRLVEEFKGRGIDISTYDFDGKEEELEVSTLPSKGPIDISAMFSALMEQMAENSKKLAEVEQSSRTNNEKLFAEVQESSRANNEKHLANNEKLLAEVQEASRATKNKLQEISDAINKRVDGIEDRISDFNTKLQQVETKVK